MRREVVGDRREGGAVEVACVLRFLVKYIPRGLIIVLLNTATIIESGLKWGLKYLSQSELTFGGFVFRE